MSFGKKPNQNSKSLSTYRWVVWGILVAIYLIVFFHRLSVGVITGELNKTFGMNATQIANLGAMYFYSYIVMQIPTGVLVDYLGPKKTVVIGSFIASIGSATFALSQNIPMAYLGRLLVGLGVSVVFLCLLKIQTSWFPADKFATMSGLTSFIGSMGGLLAQTPLVTLVALIGWRNSFLSMGILTSILAIFVILFVKNSPVEMGFEEVNPIQKSTGNKESVLSQLIGVLRNPRVWFPAFAFGGVNGGFLVFTGTFGVSYMNSVYSLSKTNAANIISVVLIISGISCLLIGGISDRLKRRKLPMLVLSSIAVAAWSVLIFLKPSVMVMSILISLVGITSSIGVICWSVGKEVSNPKFSGMAMSIVNVFGFIFTAVLMIFCGRLIDVNIANGLSPDLIYMRAFIPLVISAVISLISGLLTTETRCRNIFVDRKE